MTGRTHDLFAFSALNFVLVSNPLPSISLASCICALSAGFIGGLAPDLDQPTANLWRKIPAGSFFGRLIAPVLGGHRFVSHSVVGIFLAAVLADYILGWMNTFVLVDMHFVWNAFMIGYLSHLVIDSITVEGVPWLFPIPVKLGIPPFKALRIKTGGVFEKYIIFPGLLIFNGYLFSKNYGFYIEFVRKLF